MTEDLEQQLCSAAAKGAVKTLRHLAQQEQSPGLNFVSPAYTASPLGIAVMHGQYSAGILTEQYTRSTSTISLFVLEPGMQTAACPAQHL